ncbi:hypothetical protein GF322_02145 [Candidatus Dependentiae bacterium]|nr:hypothetical protein [Candidatus Dependentiae bacterium]
MKKISIEKLFILQFFVCFNIFAGKPPVRTTDVNRNDSCKRFKSIFKSPKKKKNSQIISDKRLNKKFCVYEIMKKYLRLGEYEDDLLNTNILNFVIKEIKKDEKYKESICSSSLRCFKLIDHLKNKNNNKLDLINEKDYIGNTLLHNIIMYLDDVDLSNYVLDKLLACPNIDVNKSNLLPDFIKTGVSIDNVLTPLKLAEDSKNDYAINKLTEKNQQKMIEDNNMLM